jgi:hypothetical protein
MLTVSDGMKTSVALSLRAIRETVIQLLRDGHDRMLLDLRAVRFIDRGMARVVADTVVLGRSRGLHIAALAAPTLGMALQALEETRISCGATPADALAQLRIEMARLIGPRVTRRLVRVPVGMAVARPAA